MGHERLRSAASLTDELDIRVILEEQRKAEARVAEAKKIADEIIAKAREQAKLMLSKAQDVALDESVKRMLEEELRKVQESLDALERAERQKLKMVKIALAKNENEVRKALLEALLR
ncbi:hypothetical protein [Infirmifilum sp. NZ]|uniref:hypothetical protein n=1 Tax=Infirmifilum sp. NZ TaxID=2926850 RepID=UPI00279A3C2C|nr:hypothetical protein [Infirmifilum sp. NZ]UNQ72866.1 hypothetical protein MOV14_07065 [Infirmifilum sp. NZ]